MKVFIVYPSERSGWALLREGDQLPKVKDVVADLAINPNTVLKAYRELEHDGLVAARPGVGTFVTATLSGAPLMMTNAISAFDMSTDAIDDIIEPLTTWLDGRNSTVQVTSQVFPFGKWINFYHYFNLTESISGGQSKVSASRLLPAKSLIDVDAVAEMLLKAGPGTEKTDVSVLVR